MHEIAERSWATLLIGGVLYLIAAIVITRALARAVDAEERARQDEEQNR